MRKKFQFLPLISLIILLFSLNIYGQNFVNKCPQPEVRQSFRSVFLEVLGLYIVYDTDLDVYEESTPELAKLNCQRLSALAKLINNTKRVFGRSLIYPQKIDVNMVEKNSGASHTADSIDIPQVYFNYSPKTFKIHTKHPKYTQPVWLHEYGHSIFSHMMKNLIPGWSRITALSSHYRKTAVSYTRNHNSLLRKCHKSYHHLLHQGQPLALIYKKLNPKCQNPIDHMRRNFTSYVDNFESELAKYRYITSASTPYDELFADSLTVAYYNNGRAIHHAMRFSGVHVHKSPHITSARDFTNQKNDLDHFVRLEPTQISFGIHDILSAARRHIWKYYLSNPLYRRTKGLILKKVLKAISIEVYNLSRLLPKEPRLYQLLFSDAGDFVGHDYSLDERRYLKEWVYRMNNSLIQRVDREITGK